jgi:hypothetical protein
MKKTSPFVFLFMCFVSLYAQDALEGIIVEKYYVSTKKDNSKKQFNSSLQTFLYHFELQQLTDKRRTINVNF